MNHFRDHISGWESSSQYVWNCFLCNSEATRIVFIRASIQVRDTGMGVGREEWKRKRRQTSLELISLNTHSCSLEISKAVLTPGGVTLWFHHNPKSTSPVRASCPHSIAPLTIPWSPRPILFLPGPLSEIYLIWDSSFACILIHPQGCDVPQFDLHAPVGTLMGPLVPST